MWEGMYSHTWPGMIAPGQVPSGATTLVGVLGPCAEGNCWYVERVSFYSNTSQGTPVLELYVVRGNQPPASATDKAGRQDVETTAATVKNGQRDYHSPIFVPPGYSLVASWSGLTAADVVQLNAQVRVHDLIRPERHRHGRSTPPELVTGSLDSI